MENEMDTLNTDSTVNKVLRWYLELETRKITIKMRPETIFIIFLTDFYSWSLGQSFDLLVPL